jgi:hypothetical protein
MRSSTLDPASHERPRLLALWTGMLAGPIVFLMLLELNYVLSYVSCETRQTWFLHLATVVAALLVGAAGGWGWSAAIGDPMQEEPETTPPLSVRTARQRVRWMAVASLGMSLWFILVILAMDVPVLVLKTCQ